MLPYMTHTQVFADATKDREMGISSWIFWVGPKCHHQCPHKREAEGDLTR